MKTLAALALVVAVVTPAAAAPTLAWDAVTTATDGSVLANGLEVKSYNVYRCATNVTPCTPALGTKVGTVTAPAVTFDLAGQPFPVNYAVTAVNIVAESAQGLTVKVVPADAPKNTRVGP